MGGFFFFSFFFGVFCFALVAHPALSLLLCARKRGRVRGNLMGKRTNHSARTVITPDALLNIDEVGVPAVIAANQTVPDRVTSRNRQMLRKACIRGPGVLMGAQLIKYEDGRMVSLAMVKERATVPLPIGAVVHRHLRDGDVVVMNRQPSLHKESMMGHYARLNTHSKTLTLPVLDCTPYNADFDGDEMNLHTPQTERAGPRPSSSWGWPPTSCRPKPTSPSSAPCRTCSWGATS